MPNLLKLSWAQPSGVFLSFHIRITGDRSSLLTFRWLDKTPTSRVITRVTQDVRTCEFSGIRCLDEMTPVFQWMGPYPIPSRGSPSSVWPC